MRAVLTASTFRLFGRWQFATSLVMAKAAKPAAKAPAKRLAGKQNVAVPAPKRGSILKKSGGPKTAAKDMRVSFNLAKNTVHQEKAAVSAAARAAAKAAPKAKVVAHAKAKAKSNAAVKPVVAAKAKGAPSGTQAAAKAEAKAKATAGSERKEASMTVPLKAKEYVKTMKPGIGEAVKKAAGALLTSTGQPQQVQQEQKQQVQIVQAQVMKMAQAANRAEQTKGKQTAAKAKASPNTSPSTCTGVNTPPPRRTQTSESLASTVKTDASESRYQASKKRAEQNLKDRQGELNQAMLEAEAAAESDAAGMSAFLEDLKNDQAGVHPGDISEHMKEKECAARDSEVASEADEEEDGGEGEEEEEQEEDPEEEPAADEKPEHEEEAGEGEGGQAEGEEEEEPAAEEEGEEEDEEVDEEEEDNEQEEEEQEKGGSPAETDPTEKPKVKNELQEITNSTLQSANGTKEVRNSTTHKKEYDKFNRQLKTDMFPTSCEESSGEEEAKEQ